MCPVESPVDTVVVSEAMVNSNARLVVVRRGRLNELIVRKNIGTNCQVGKRIILLQHELGGWAKPVLRNYVAWERITNDASRVGRILPACGRIEDLVLKIGAPQTVGPSLGAEHSREITLAHGLGWYVSKEACALSRSKAFPVNRKPGIVPSVEVRKADGSPEVDSILILPIRWFLAVEEVSGVQFVIAEKLPQ